ncbi:VOC family protein [Notoacmeibacter marinus]|uniref:VOC family protein n=1 Tax=Notoacmeibacter marinus TaxID=1876515 RepID=UPI000DF2CB37|nr:VOC family protein [Notoacmeibacter marinus]
MAEPVTAKVRTCLWFDGDAEDAASFYVSLLHGSRIENVAHVPDGMPDEMPITTGDVMMVDFTLAGTPYQAMNGGMAMPRNEYASISVLTDDQDETDRLWNALIEGGREVQCGWCRDRFDIPWQIVPRRFLELMQGEPNRRSRVMNAMFAMTKFDIAALEVAAEDA